MAEKTKKLDRADKINGLRSRQQEKKSQIERYKKNANKRMFIFSLTIALVTLFFLEDSYKVFGDIETFVTLSISILFSVVIGYYLVVFLLVKRRKKEIKKINGKIHRLMRLKKDEEEN